jgi:hypothetical protein
MAALPADALVKLRNGYERDLEAIAHVKSVASAVDQAIEDGFDAALPGIRTAMETAAPGVFTTGQKNKRIKNWLRNRLERS